MKHSRFHLLKFRVCRRNFTLIELLVVLAIVGVIIGIALPAFEKLAVGSGVDAATRMVAGQLRLTREYAITKRQTVAMLLPAVTGPTGTNYCAFKPCVVIKSGSNWNWQSWIPNTKWEFLPSGTIIVEADRDVLHNAETSTEHIEDGAPVGAPANDPERWKDDAESLVQNVDLDGDDEAETNSVRALIFKPTGALGGGLPKYVTIVEGFYDGTAIRDRNRQNRRAIEVDIYTGRVTHRPR